jgi:hypothetical protein
LNPSGIAELLQRYPDKRFVDTITTIATSGARLGYEGSLLGQTRRPNHASSFSHADVITDQIQNEISKGRIKEIADLPSNYFCSPIGLTPKITEGTQAGWRVIFDLSSPEGHSVNDNILKEYGTIIYETLGDAIRLVAQAGKGAIMMKRDLKSAFRHVPINPCDYWLLIFEWQGKFYVDMFLPFGLRTAPRIFNLFAEALHWVFETLEEWNVTHYLDDFLFVFPPGTDIGPYSSKFDEILSVFGLSKAAEKDSDGCVVIHLGFEFDSINMQVRLPPNKKQRAIDAVNSLLSSPHVSIIMLESTLGFLSHCCQVVPLGRPFLRQLFSLLCRTSDSKHRHRRLHIPRIVKKDLEWWLRFLTSWSSISMIQFSRENHDLATDASGVKGIGGVYRRRIFSERMPAKHRPKHIDWKEMFAVLHAFLLWHESWTGGVVRLACDNSVVVDAINKRSIRGITIRPLQSIFLISAAFDIDLHAFWIPSEENIVADAASRHDYAKLANLGFQVSPTHRNPSTSALRQKLQFCFSIPSHPPLAVTTPKHNILMNSSAEITVTSLPSPPPSSQLHTGSQMSCSQQNPRLRKVMSQQSVRSISKTVSPSQFSTTPASTLLSEAENVSMVKVSKNCAFRSPPQSSFELSMKSGSTRKVSTSNQRSVWHLPPFYDLENLRGMLHGPEKVTSPTSPANTSFSTPMTP